MAQQVIEGRQVKSELRNVDHLGVLIRDQCFESIKEKMNSSNFGRSQDFMHMPPRVNISFDYFLGHLRVPLVKSLVNDQFFIHAA